MGSNRLDVHLLWQGHSNLDVNQHLMPTLTLLPLTTFRQAQMAGLEKEFMAQPLIASLLTEATFFLRRGTTTGQASFAGELFQ
jgi:hypothetical protein